MNRRFVSILLLQLFVALVFKDLILYLDLYVNRAYIAEVLCINKDKPMVMCYGSCYVNKTINDSHEKDQQVPNPVKEKKSEYLNQIRHTGLHFSILQAPDNQNIRPFRDVLSGILPIHDIFHPPRLS
jgi:hypothetical protein